MNKAIFLDRDGVLNRELGHYVSKPEEFEILPGVAEMLSEWQKAGYILFVITNQAGISKGIYTHENLKEIHQKLLDHLAAHSIKIQEIYYSPYHEDYCNSLNRKPDSLMLERAIHKYNIDPTLSYMIGDSERDIEAAAKAGICGVKVESNGDLRALQDRVRLILD